MEAKVEEKNQLVTLVDQSGLEPETNEALKNAFLPFYEQAAEWKRKAESLVVTDPSQKREMQEARVARLALKDIRVNVEKRRKDLKEDSLKKGKAIDGVANMLKSLIEPIEEHLDKQEKFAENLEKQRKEQLKADRIALLAPFQVSTEFYDLVNMPESEFNHLMASKKAEYEARLEAERKAEEERQAVAVREAEERERMRLENERLKAEKEEQERIMREERMQAEQTRKEQEEQLRLEREANEKKLADERAKQIEEQKKLRDEAQRKLAAEQAERKKLEDELKAKAEAEAKAKAENEARLEAELSKGDKAKFEDMVKDLEALKAKYSFKTKKYRMLHAGCIELLNKTINYLISKQ